MGARGEVLASNCFVDCHLEPTRRGTMSLRRTWHNPGLVEDAVRRLRHLGWQGAAMLEYRVRDGDGGFDFIELNPRNWQSLHLDRSEEHTSELQSLMRISYAVFCLKKKKY